MDTNQYINSGQQQTPHTSAVSLDQHTQLSGRAQVISEANEHLSYTPIGLPENFYRADLIPGDLRDGLYSPEQINEILDCAIVELDYSQGYPTLATGDPFWSQLPGEHGAAYNAFMSYLEMPRDEDKRTVIMPDGTVHALVNHEAVPVRQIHLLKKFFPAEKDNLLNYSHMYYWAPRTRAYDLFYAAMHNKRKEQRLMQLEDDHYGKATKLLNYANDKLETLMQDPDQEWSAKTLLDMLWKMAQLQRISVGASATGVSGNASNQAGMNIIPQNASMEVILRTLAQNAGVETKTVNGSDSVKSLMSDPAALRSAQELIIKMQTNANPRTATRAYTDMPEEGQPTHQGAQY